MKLLFIPTAECPFRLPRKASVGGVGTLEKTQVEWLQERHDVDFLCSSDSEVNPPYEGKVILGSFSSKETTGKVDAVSRTKDLLSIIENYDRVVCNDIRFSPKYLGDLIPHADKLRLISHNALSFYINAFAVSGYQMHWVLSQNNARVGHVQPDIEKGILENLDKIAKNPYKIKGYDFGSFGNKFEVLDFLFPDKELRSSSLSLEDKWVIIGRADPGKKNSFGMRAWQKSGVPGELVVLTQDPILRDPEEFNLMKQIAREDSRIRLIIGAPRSEVIKELSSAKGLIFPSVAEAMPLVPFEAMACGTPVLFSLEITHPFMNSIEGNRRVPRRTLPAYAKAIQEMNTSLEDKRRIQKETLDRCSEDKCKQAYFDFVS